MSARDSQQLGETIVERCLDAGFAAAGVCDVSPGAHADALLAWLDDGKHGSMGWMAEFVNVRTDPSKLMEGARACVMVADLYQTRTGSREAKVPGVGRVARYARGRDYHKVIKRRLHAICDRLRGEVPGAEFRSFVDSAPVMERELATRAGIGATGKHTLTIHPELGSYMVLGGFVTTLELMPPASQRVLTDPCKGCTRCIDACPTDAITPWSVDARRCISYLTIERSLPIDPAFHAAIGDWLFGCDICQEVCPHNQPTRKARYRGDRVLPEYEPVRTGFDLLDVLGWGEDDRRSACSVSAMKRVKLDEWKRNAVIVAGNWARERPELLDRVRDIAGDEAESDGVRETARVVLRRST
ncbi:MAG: tRNA epoxyqueuosine(34) reductase QueG [Planctomycetota bacterium]